jgi:hypothetical protein
MVKSRSGSSNVDSSTYVPMIGCFVAGFVTNRFLNHQNVVTGELEEGLYSMDEIVEYWTKPGSGGFGHDISQSYFIVPVCVFFVYGFVMLIRGDDKWLEAQQQASSPA